MIIPNYCNKKKARNETFIENVAIWYNNSSEACTKSVPCTLPSMASKYHVINANQVLSHYIMYNLLSLNPIIPFLFTFEIA